MILTEGAQARETAPRRRATPATIAAGLLVLALALRVGYVIDTWRFVPILDGRSYDWLARELTRGHGWAMGTSAYRPPAYPLLLSVIYRVVGIPPPHYAAVTAPYAGWTAARLAEACEATVSLGLLALVACELTGRRVALATLAIGAVYPPLIVVGVSLMSESLLVPVMLAATLCALRSHRSAGRGRIGLLVLAGLLCGVAALTRGNALVIGVALGAVVWKRPQERSLRGIGAPAVLIGTMALTVLPWTIRNAVAQHAFVPVTTELGSTLAGTYNSVSARHHYIWTAGHQYGDYREIRRDPRLTEAQRDSKLTSAVAGYIWSHPSAVPLTIFWNTARLLDLEGRFISRRSARIDLGASSSVADISVFSFWLVGGFAIAGVFTRSARRIRRVVWLLPVLLWFSEVPITTGTPRFRAVLEPWFVLLAACAVAAAGRSLSGRSSRLQTYE